MSFAQMVGAAAAGIVLVVLIVWRQPALAFAVKTSNYLREVQVELKKVTWPEWDDLKRSTAVIVVFVVIIGVIIGLMDRIFSWLLIDILGGAFG